MRECFSEARSLRFAIRAETTRGTVTAIPEEMGT
jgi:hypothetical protein